MHTRQAKVGRAARAALAALAAGLLAASAGADEGEAIRNPYHKTRQWKLWAQDPSPVKYRTNRGDEKTVQPPPEDRRLWPVEPPAREPGVFMVWKQGPEVDSPYAGIWDDAYSSRDNRHSYLRDGWNYDGANAVRIRDSVIHFVGGRDLHALGVNFTSQSTTGMGHDIANSDQWMHQLERAYYFGNIVRAGPAHISFMDRRQSDSADEYYALVPSFYNSVGSSGSETWALTKMVIAGGHLPKAVKPLVKKHGLYPATLLYIWKAALPYDVPYGHELIHRVAYNSKGDHSDYGGSNQTQFNELCHNYDETAHMRNMVALAKRMDTPPPIALLRNRGVAGGELVYAHKTAMLVHQRPGQTVRIRVSPNESYDLAHRPLSFRWALLHGNRDTTIQKDPDGRAYTITVPWDDALPAGRTAIALIANNGKFDSNPAVVNVYRIDPTKDSRGRLRNKLPKNLRPTLLGLEDRTILPGETAEVEITGVDPEGVPLRYAHWAGEVGELDGNVFRWECPADQPAGDYPVTLIGSDGTCGYSLCSGRFHVHVRPAVAVLNADRTRGRAPLKVRFSAEGSRDAAGEAAELAYKWDFDDGTTSNEAAPAHEFTKPGLRMVKLTVTGPSGSHTAERLIEVLPDWPLVINNGWRRETVKGEDGKDKPVSKIDEAVWEAFDPFGAASVGRGGKMLQIYHAPKKGGQMDPRLKELLEKKLGEDQSRFRLTSQRDFAPPLYLEAVYQRWKHHDGPGTGFDLLGTQIGRPGYRRSSTWWIALGQPSDQTEQDRRHGEIRKWHVHRLAQKVRFIWCRTRLRVFVEQDPGREGRLRFTGVLDTGKGRHVFRVGDLKQLHDKIAVIARDPATRIQLYQFQVWAPDGTAAAGPEINVFGNGDRALDDAGAWMMFANGQDFLWPKRVGGTVTKTLVVRNDGAEPLRIEKVELRGKGAQAFALASPAPETIAPGRQAELRVSFTPKGPGLHEAELHVHSDDADEADLAIPLRGRGATPADINVQGHGLNIASGDTTPNPADHTWLPTRSAGEEPVTRTFRIENCGHETLKLTGPVRITGDGAEEFTVVTAPRETIAALGSTRLGIRWQPTASAVRNVVVTIPSNDAGTPAYTFALRAVAMK